MPTWFHELGHIVFPRIDEEQIARLAAEAKKHFPVVSTDEVLDARDPDTMETIALPNGTYLNINRMYCGLDHSGDGEIVVNDEIWAILFTEYYCGFELPQSIRALLNEIIGELES